MCLKLGAKKYIFGSQGKNYADERAFLSNGVTPYFQDYIHPIYNQLYAGFLPYMSVIDLIFNHGTKSYDILMSNNKIFTIQK